MRCVAALLLFVSVGLVCAQMPDASIVARVQQEEFAARKYLETILKLQHSQYNTMAGNQFVQLLMLEYQENKSPSKSFEEDDDFVALVQEDANTLFGENTNSGWGYDLSTNKKQVQADLLGSYYLFYATKIKFLQTLFHAADIQREFWADRHIQLQIQALGNQVPAQLLQVMYMKLYRTQLATLKLSLALQSYSHYTMWLEDAIDVNTALLDDSNTHSQIVAEDQADDLINDKLYAFTALNSYALTDYQLFLIDLYFEQITAQAAAAAAAPAPAPAPQAQTDSANAAFLEEQATAEPSSFFPFFGAAAGAFNPAAYAKYYKYLFIIYQLNSASSALTSVQAEKLAYEKENDNDASNDKDAEQYRKFAQQMFGSYGSNLVYASQIEYFTSVFELYSMYAPVQATPVAANANASA